jgi:hypothetical protein
MAALIRMLLCVLDLGHCVEIVETTHGLRCAVVAPRNTCPMSLDASGWHQSIGVTACSRDCGADDVDDTTRTSR